MTLREQVEQLEARRRALAADIDAAAASPEAQREQLVEQIQRNNADIAVIQQQ